MKKPLFMLLCLVLLMLSACASQTEGSGTPVQPWPSHAPGSSPYISPQGQQAQSPEIQVESYESWEALLESMYERENNFFFKDWELEMFKALPQDEPYYFTVHLYSTADYGSNENDIIAAEDFSALGAEAQVKAYTLIENGMEETSYTCFVRCTPAELWEMSSRTQELYFIEQRYESVAQRYDTHIWPEEGQADHG